MAEQFAALLETLASPDNDTRNAGEAQYNNIPVEQRMDFLIQSIEGSSQASLRSFAAILLRRLLTSHWDAFVMSNESAKIAFKTSLLKVSLQCFPSTEITSTSLCSGAPAREGRELPEEDLRHCIRGGPQSSG